MYLTNHWGNCNLRQPVRMVNNKKKSPQIKPGERLRSYSEKNCLK